MCQTGRTDILLPRKAGYGESVTATPDAHAVGLQGSGTPNLEINENAEIWSDACLDVM